MGRISRVVGRLRRRRGHLAFGSCRPQAEPGVRDWMARRHAAIGAGHPADVGLAHLPVGRRRFHQPNVALGDSLGGFGRGANRSELLGSGAGAVGFAGSGRNRWHRLGRRSLAGVRGGVLRDMDPALHHHVHQLGRRLHRVVAEPGLLADAAGRRSRQPTVVLLLRWVGRI